MERERVILNIDELIQYLQHHFSMKRFYNTKAKAPTLY